MVPALHQMSLYVIRCHGNRILTFICFQQTDVQIRSRRVGNFGAYICEVITVRLIQQYE